MRYQKEQESEKNFLLEFEGAPGMSTPAKGKFRTENTRPFYVEHRPKKFIMEIFTCISNMRSHLKFLSNLHRLGQV